MNINIHAVDPNLILFHYEGNSIPAILMEAKHFHDACKHKIIFLYKEELDELKGDNLQWVRTYPTFTCWDTLSADYKLTEEQIKEFSEFIIWERIAINLHLLGLSDEFVTELQLKGRL